MIYQITASEIINCWREHLWQDRNSPIKLTSSMKLGGGYDMIYHKNSPYLWGIVLDNKLVAVQSGHKCNNAHFRIRGLWVDSEYRNRGLARQLFDNAESKALSLGCSIIWSYPRNSSLNAYKKCGYTIFSGPINDITEIHGPYWYVFKELKEMINYD